MTLVDSDNLMLIGLLALAAVSVGAIVYLLVTPYFSGERRTDKRLQDLTDTKSRRLGAKTQADIAQNRKRQVADTLKELEDRQKTREKVSLRLRLERAGVDITPRAYWLASIGCGIALAACIWLSAPNLPIIVPMLGLFVGGLGLPRWFLARLTKRRQNKFTDEFANAIDVIVRGVKSGLPLPECMGIIARESPDPVGTEFTELVEQQRVGVPMSEAFERMMTRMPMAGGALLRHRHRHPAAGRRQPVGGAGQPLRRAARPQAPAGQGARAVRRGQGVGRRARRAALRRHDPRLHHHPRLHQPALDHQVRPVPAGVRRSSG